MPSRKPSNLVYWLRREADERAQTEHGVDAIRALHTQLADGYAALIRAQLGDACFERAKQRNPDDPPRHQAFTMGFARLIRAI